MAEESNRYTFRLLAVGLFLIVAGDRLAAATGAAFRAEDFSAMTVTTLILVAIVVFTTMLTTITLALLPVSDRHTFIEAVLHLYANLVLFFRGSYRLRVVEQATKNPRERQDALLISLLKSNADTEYGRLNGFGRIKTREEFRDIVPFASYETFRPYIDRIEKCEQGLLTKEPVVRFNISTETADGKCRMVPAPRGYDEYLFQHLHLPQQFLQTNSKKDAFLAPLRSGLFVIEPRWRLTEKGLPIGPSFSFEDCQKTHLFKLSRTLPMEADVSLSEQGQLYLQMYFALTDREMARIDAIFPCSIIGAFEFLEKNWQSLVRDVRNGVISEKYDITRDLVNKLIKNGRVWAEAKRADEIQRECSLGFEGIALRLWPRIQTVCCNITGANDVHREKLQWYCGSTVRFFSGFIHASEAIIAMNMDGPGEVTGDEQQVFTLLPDASFMEFIEENEISRPEPKTHFIDQLEVGRRYELVVTSMFGFYRYRIGHILEVVRHRHGKTPVVKFCARVDTLLDLIGEKISNDQILAALRKASQTFKGCHSIVNFTTTDSATWRKMFASERLSKSSIAKSSSSSIIVDGYVVVQKNSEDDASASLYHVIFVEFEGIQRELSQAEVSAFDRQLCEISVPYKTLRSKGSLAKPKVVTVMKGTFNKLREFSAAMNTDTYAIISQYETPRYLKTEEHLNILVSGAFPNRQAVITSPC